MRTLTRTLWCDGALTCVCLQASLHLPKMAATLTRDPKANGASMYVCMLATLLPALKMSVPVVVSCKDTNFNNSSCTSYELSIVLIRISSWLTSITSVLSSKAKEKYLQSCINCFSFPSHLTKSASHRPTGQGDCFKVFHHVIVTKSFGHFYGTPLHNFAN